MDILDKLSIIESNTVPKEGAVIETLSTSIEITHRCGCVLVEHFASEEPQNCGTSRKTDAERRYYIELCPMHGRFDKEYCIPPKGDNGKKLSPF